MGRSTIFHGKKSTISTGPCSIAMLDYQRIPILLVIYPIPRYSMIFPWNISIVIPMETPMFDIPKWFNSYVSSPEANPQWSPIPQWSYAEVSRHRLPHYFLRLNEAKKGHVSAEKSRIFSNNTGITLAGWWFGTMEFYEFPFIGNAITSTDELHHFSEG